MGDLLKARINAIEQIREKFGHEIQEIKKELARLAKLVEPCIKAKVGYPQKSSLSPTRLGPRFANVQVLNKASRLQATRLIAPTCGLHRTGQRATQKHQS